MLLVGYHKVSEQLSKSAETLYEKRPITEINRLFETYSAPGEFGQVILVSDSKGRRSVKGVEKKVFFFVKREIP